MIFIASINLIIQQPTQLALSDGSPAGVPLQPGNYVAELNVGQQPGSYSLYTADASFQKTSGSVANVCLSIATNGQVDIVA